MKLAAFVLAGLLAAGCAATTYDASDQSAAPTTPTTSTTPSTDPFTVLPVMLSEVSDLARRVAESDEDGAAATRIEVMWAAISEPVSAARPDLVRGFEFVVRRCRAAADRNRPADADRALKDLQALVESYLG